MKRSALLIGLVVCLVVVLAAGTLFAQQPGKPGGSTASETKKPPAKRLPDLTIDKIYLVKDCRVAVVVKNLGPGPVPDEVWTVHHPKSAGVYLYRNGTGWGGGSIWKFDTAKNLQPPGGTATYVSKLKVSGTETITAVVDLWNDVKEAKENNNKRKERLTCKLPPVGKCCIAGTYNGTSVDDPKCPVGPETGDFTLILKQTNCGSQVEGDILDPATGAVTSKFKGTVTPAGKCCKIVGRTKGVPGGPDENCIHDVTATLCKNKLGKWYVTDGVYKVLSGKCCSGKFKMEQL